MFALAVKENQPAKARLSPLPPRSQASPLQQEQARNPLIQNPVSRRNFSEIAVFSPAEPISIPVQAKLKVGAVDDPLEQEADRVADHVTGTSIASRSTASASPVSQVPGSVDKVLGSAGQPLDAQARAFMEPHFGFNFGQVTVHAGSAAARTAEELGAQAFTAGQQIVFGAGQYQPGTAHGQRLLAHELTHVVQQTGPATSRRPAGLLQRQPDDKKPPAAPAPTTAPTATPAPTAAPAQPDKNPLDDKAKKIIAAAKDSSKPLDQRAIAAVNDIVAAYYDTSMVDSVVYVEGETGLHTSPVGKGQAIKGKIEVGKYFVENIDQFARRVMQVGHELQHVQQFRDGKSGDPNKPLREFLAFYWAVTQPEKPGTGRVPHGTRIDQIDAALKNYYCLSEADQKANESKRDELLKLRGEDETKGHKDHTDPPTTCKVST